MSRVLHMTITAAGVSDCWSLDTATFYITSEYLNVFGFSYYICISDRQTLQCFDTVGWATGRGSGL